LAIVLAVIGMIWPIQVYACSTDGSEINVFLAVPEGDWSPEDSTHLTVVIQNKSPHPMQLYTPVNSWVEMVA
jgi:hypothetical protein